MPFPADVAEQLLVSCARHCCLCREFKGQKMELHHIEQDADGGASTFENGLPVCFDCHAEVNSYNDRHPRGRKYRVSELKQLRDQWFKLVAEGRTSGQPPVVLPWLASPPATIGLSKEARELLLAAADGQGRNQGIIVCVEYPSGGHFDAGDRLKLNPPTDKRRFAEYKHGMDQLVERGLAEQRSEFKYELTREGYLLADDQPPVLADRKVDAGGLSKEAVALLLAAAAGKGTREGTIMVSYVNSGARYYAGNSAQLNSNDDNRQTMRFKDGLRQLRERGFAEGNAEMARLTTDGYRVADELAAMAPDAEREQ